MVLCIVTLVAQGNSVKNEGDAVDLVLRRLGELNYPPFVLACRIADWRSATGLEGIREQYDCQPLELHLEPFDDDDAITFLRGRVGIETAQAVVTTFNQRGLHGFLGNPQTLELIARVASQGDLPQTQGELFERAVEVLRVEHSDGKADNQLARETGLDAAGAAFAALILTGTDALVRSAAANDNDGELQLAEIRRLPGGDAVAVMLDTRLFKAEGPDRFSYWHRRIGEYLGARWLAKLADNRQKRARLLSLFQSHGIVPASLRGIHAWLARDPELAPAVLAADPMGVIEYGDADNLTPQHARVLIDSLRNLAMVNARFRDWRPYRVRSIGQPALVEDVRRLITADDTPFGLRLLIIESVKGTLIASALSDELWDIVLNPNAIFANRSAAGEVLAVMNCESDWSTVVRSLCSLGDELSLRLAFELMGEIGYEPFDDQLIVDLVIAYAARE